MKKDIRSLAPTAISALFFASLVPVQAASYAISWTGSDDITLSGTFSFDDSLLNTGPIDETQIDTLEFEAFDNGMSLGSVDLENFDLVDADPFNFNFDTTSEQFVVGGSGGGTAGQVWNTFGSPIGFASGLGIQGVTVQSLNPSIFYGDIPTGSSTLTATRILDPSPIPEPSSALTLGGLIGLGLFLRRRRS